MFNGKEPVNKFKNKSKKLIESKESTVQEVNDNPEGLPKDAEGLERLNVEVPRGLHTKLKKRSVEDNISIRAIVIKALNSYISK